MDEKISIIVPVYNTELFLRKCLYSIINQDYLNLEIIIIDDGSTDSSLEICKEFKNKDSRIILISQENKGVASARNKGLEIATGDYIGFVDSDDYISKDMYKQLLTAGLLHDADIIECGYYETDYKYEIIKKVSFEKSVVNRGYNCSYDLIQRRNVTYFNCTKLYKQTVIKDIRFSNYKIGEDHLFNVEAFHNCNKKVTITDCCYYYVRNKNSVTMKEFSKSDIDRILAKDEIVNFYHSNRPELANISRMFVMESIIVSYLTLLRSSVDNKKKYKNYLMKKFRLEYSAIKCDLNRITNKKRVIKAYFFNVNPNIIYYLIKLKGLIL